MDDPVRRLQEEADEWRKIYAETRNLLAEMGFEVLPQDLRNAVATLTERGEDLLLSSVIREALGPDRYLEFLGRHQA